MKPLIEMNRLSVLIDRSELVDREGATLISEGNLPVTGTPFQVELIDIPWLNGENPPAPEKFVVRLGGSVIDPRWKVKFVLDAIVEYEQRNKIAQWGESFPLELIQLYFDNSSQILIDDRTIDLIPTINQVLARKITANDSLDYPWLNTQVSKISQEYFGSDVLTDLLANLYYQVLGDHDDHSGLFSISAAYELKHFSQIEEAPPYLFVKLPTNDIEYFVNHYDWPDIDIKGYQLIIKTLEVKDVNGLKINVVEVNKEWLFTIGMKLILKNNTIQAQVQIIESEGLGILAKTLFKIFKGVLKRQIEAKPIPVTDVYQQILSKLEINYPFLHIQQDQLPYLDALSMCQEDTEIMIHFEEDNQKETA